ncbi:hypothetical protein Poly21_57080 [Allorhodopirellula heiligendammensis]|uniref:Uncharacterized protein n=1 Tax=Allorhodopirellula heiligendammensis TaxID=2714739 RepID=A0A5C6B1D8_9BACT|nr:hypothetical protein Poly21_57080 [Allorhodopirellula heiligendammensis]
MAFPLKGSTAISVDGVAYRWRIRSRPTYDQQVDAPMTFAVQATGDPHCVLHVTTNRVRPDRAPMAPSLSHLSWLQIASVWHCRMDGILARMAVRSRSLPSFRDDEGKHGFGVAALRERLSCQLNTHICLHRDCSNRSFDCLAPNSGHMMRRELWLINNCLKPPITNAKSFTC